MQVLGEPRTKLWWADVLGMCAFSLIVLGAVAYLVYLLAVTVF